VKIKLVLLTFFLLASYSAVAQRLAKQSIYAGGMGGVATLSGDGSANITPSSASTSLFDPDNGGAAEVFAGVHLFEYISFQVDYVYNRNNAVVVSTSGESNALNFFRQPESITQNAFLANVLIYFRKRNSRIRPYLSEAGGAVLLHSRLSGPAVVGGSVVLPPPASDHASIALRTSVGVDFRLRGPWYFRYSFGETITRNMLGDQVAPPQHRIPKNFQNLFGVYFRF
jgi:hypothetical protein